MSATFGGVGVAPTVATTAGQAEAFAVAERLRVEAFARRVPQAELAKACGVNRGTMNEWLNGKSPIPLSAHFDICSRMGIDPADVLQPGAAGSSKGGV